MSVEAGKGQGKRVARQQVIRKNGTRGKLFRPKNQYGKRAGQARGTVVRPGARGPTYFQVRF